MDDTTMTLHDVFTRHRLYKVTDAEVEATMRGEKMTWVYDLLIGAAPAAGDLATDVRLWQADLQSRGHYIDEPEGLWLGMAASRPDLVWLQPLLDRLGNRLDVLRCRYYLAVLCDEGSARYLSRVAERSHDLSAAFSHGMHLHVMNLKRIGSAYAWYPGVETMILVEGCRRLAGLKGADRSAQAVVPWCNQTRLDRYQARMDGKRRFLRPFSTTSANAKGFEVVYVRAAAAFRASARCFGPISTRCVGISVGLENGWSSRLRKFTTLGALDLIQ